MTPEKLKAIIAKPFYLKRRFRAKNATYRGSVIPLPGRAEVTVSRNGVNALITDRMGWEQRAFQHLPPGTMGDPAIVFRPVAPGWLVRPEHYGTIETDRGWTGERTLYVNRSERYGGGRYCAKFRFRIDDLKVEGPAHGHEVAGLRSIYRRGAFSAACEVDGKPIIAYALSKRDVPLENETMAVVFDGVPEEKTQDAVWHVLNLLSGNTLQHLADEHYDEDGELVVTHFRIAHDWSDARREFFHWLFPDYGRLADNGFETLVLGIRELLRREFPIDVVLHHLHVSPGQASDLEAQHLVLAIHTAIEAWNRHFDQEVWIEDNVWDKIQRRLRGPMKELGDYSALGDEMKDNVRSSMAHANRTTTNWRQDRLFEALGIDISDADNQRALKLRNEILHNGYFLRRWDQLSHDERQDRYHDIERLRRLVLLVVFKLAGYTGDFRSPLTFFKEHVDSSSFELPAGLTSVDSG